MFLTTLARVRLPTSAGGDFRVSVHHADLLTELVDKNNDGIGLADSGGKLPKRLAHQTRVEANVTVPHLALDFRAGHQSRHAVHHNHINGSGTNQGFRNLKGLLAGVGLGDQQVLDFHSQGAGIGGVQSVFRVHEGHLAALLLGLRHHVEGQGCLA